jgi:hypothetical protein
LSTLEYRGGYHITTVFGSRGIADEYVKKGFDVKAMTFGCGGLSYEYTVVLQKR